MCNQVRMHARMLQFTACVHHVPCACMHPHGSCRACCARSAHGQGSPAADAETALRRATLALCNADSALYDVVLTTGATAALKLVRGVSPAWSSDLSVVQPAGTCSIPNIACDRTSYLLLARILSRFVLRTRYATCSGGGVCALVPWLLLRVHTPEPQQCAGDSGSRMRRRRDGACSRGGWDGKCDQ